MNHPFWFNLSDKLTHSLSIADIFFEETIIRNSHKIAVSKRKIVDYVNLVLFFLQVVQGKRGKERDWWRMWDSGASEGKRKTRKMRK